MGRKTHRERELPEPHTRVPEPPEWGEGRPVDMAVEEHRLERAMEDESKEK
jgi:hypothetical protein